MASTSTNRRQGINTGAAVKVACKAATTADITLSGEQTIDGISCTDGDRVLVMEQDTASENGIYVVDTSTWQRDKDFDGTFDVVEGTLIPVSRGTTNGGQVFRVTNTGTITIGTTSLTFTWALDAASMVFLQSGTATSMSLQDRGRLLVYAQDYGIVGDGSTTESFTDLQTYLATLTKPIRLVFPAKSYVIGSVTNLDLPDNSVVDALGADFTCTHNGVAFDCNPDATAAIPLATTNDTVTKRNITWLGGTFTNTNATKTASVAIQAYFMRGFRVMYARAGDTSGNGFYAFVKFGAKDSYRFIDCYSYGCVRHYWVPAAGVLHTASLSGNDLIDPEWRGCQMSSDGSTDESGIYMENRVQQFKLIGGNISGVFSVAHVRLADNSSVASRGYKFDGVRMEQMAADTPAVLFTSAGGTGHIGIEFSGGFDISSATANWRGVTLARCQGVQFGAGTFLDGSSARAGYGVYVDSNSRDIRFGRACVFSQFMDSLTITDATDNGSGLIRIESTAHGLQTGDRVWITGVTGTTEANAMWVVTVIDADNFDLQSSTFSSAYVSGGTAKLLNAIEVQTTAARAHITLEPEVVNLSTNRVLSSFNDTAKSTASEATVNMSTEYSEFISTSINSWLWPKGYQFHVRARDSGSAAAAADAVFVKVKRPSALQIAGVLVYLAGTTNDEFRGASGHVGANDDGNIGVTLAASGSGTLDVGIGVSAVYQ